jgi:hypothetical protein
MSPDKSIPVVRRETQSYGPPTPEAARLPKV